jgi:hypothetical protein
VWHCCRDPRLVSHNLQAGCIDKLSVRWVLAAEAPNMNDTQRWLVGLRPRHNPAENALIANMRDDPNIPSLNSLAAMRHYARQRWPHDPAVQSLIPALWQRYRRWHNDNSQGHCGSVG